MQSGKSHFIALSRNSYLAQNNSRIAPARSVNWDKVGISFVVQSGNWNKVGISYIAIYFKSLFFVYFRLMLFNSLALIVCVPFTFCVRAGCGI